MMPKRYNPTRKLYCAYCGHLLNDHSAINGLCIHLDCNCSEGLTGRQARKLQSELETNRGHTLES